MARSLEESKRGSDRSFTNKYLSFGAKIAKKEKSPQNQLVTIVTSLGLPRNLCQFLDRDYNMLQNSGRVLGLYPVTMPSWPCSVNRAAAGQWQLAWAVVINCDGTAGHYYSQLMITAHASCCWPAAARFIEHGQLAGHCPMLGNQQMTT